MPLNEEGLATRPGDEPMPSTGPMVAEGPVVNPAFSYIRLERHGKDRNLAGDRRFLTPTVRQWVADGFNIGVRTGTQSGLWVLDVDVDVHTGEPSREWAALFAQHGLPSTYTVRTPSGGLHYYFRLPEGVEIRDDNHGKAIAPNVDVKAHPNSYVVAAGCFASYEKQGVHFEGTYVVVDDSPVAPTPDWIIERFRGREEKAAVQRVNSDEVMPKAEVIEDRWDRFAKDELNDLFAQVDQLAALPEGESMEILGEPRGWERGAGFFTLACRIVEVARWPHTLVSVEMAHQVWAERVPPKYVVRTWNEALQHAGPTWPHGDDEHIRARIFADAPTQRQSDRTSSEAKPAEEHSIFDFPEGALASGLFRKKKDDEEDDASGPFMTAVARKAVVKEGPIAIDNTGSFWTYQGGVYVPNDGVVLNRLYHMLGNRFTSSHLRNTTLAVQAKAPRLDLAKAPSPEVMNFRNGTLRWKDTDKLEDHDPEVLSTTQFPYDWDPTATCPRFDHWLETMLDADQITLAWKVLGYMMLSGNPLQVAFMLYGKGSNGKSTFVHVVEHLVGESNRSAVPLKDFNERFATSAIIGKIANVVGDIDSDYQVSTAALKQITGADTLQFERKNKNPFSATLWATCLFSANKIPGTNDRSEGYTERWAPIHFQRKARAHKIAGFSEEALWREVPGIAAKAVRALRTMPLEQGSDRAEAFDLTSESARAAVEDFREASNSYYEWVKNHTMPSETEVMKPKELWAAFKHGTGSKHGGTYCPKDFQAVLTERYGPPKQQRGFFLGVDRNIRGHAVALVDDNDDINDPSLFNKSRDAADSFFGTNPYKEES